MLQVAAPPRTLTLPPHWVYRLRDDIGTDHRSQREFQSLYRLEQMRSYLEVHLGATIKDAARDLDWSYRSARVYMHLIRKEWAKR